MLPILNVKAWNGARKCRSSGQSVQSSICTYIQMAWVSSPTHSLTHRTRRSPLHASHMTLLRNHSNAKSISHRSWCS